MTLHLPVVVAVCLMEKKKGGIEYLKFKAACETSVKQNTSLGLSKVQHQFQMIRVKYELINSGGKVFLPG